MSITILVIEALIFAAVFTAILFSALGKKETTASIHMECVRKEDGKKP